MSTTIWERTETALSGLGVDLAANVMLSDTDDTLPDTFLVYQLISSPPAQAADDDETLRWYRMQVAAYSRDGLATLPDIPAAMVAAGFTKSIWRELPYNQDSRHFGIAYDFIYTE